MLGDRAGVGDDTQRQRVGHRGQLPAHIGGAIAVVVDVDIGQRRRRDGAQHSQPDLIPRPRLTLLHRLPQARLRISNGVDFLRPGWPADRVGHRPGDLERDRDGQRGRDDVAAGIDQGQVRQVARAREGNHQVGRDGHRDVGLYLVCRQNAHGRIGDIVGRQRLAAFLGEPGFARLSEFWRRQELVLIDIPQCELAGRVEIGADAVILHAHATADAPLAVGEFADRNIDPAELHIFGRQLQEPDVQNAALGERYRDLAGAREVEVAPIAPRVDADLAPHDADRQVDISSETV